MRKSAIVCGAGGFIASHLVKRKVEGYWVRGLDIKLAGLSAKERP
jgi:GDP-D-mannose 3', 5'-epimerase